MKHRKTETPPVYDIWEHYHKIRAYRKWLILNKDALCVGWITPYIINLKIDEVSFILKEMEPLMQFEFIGDISELFIYKSLHSFHKVAPNLNGKNYLVQS